MLRVPLGSDWIFPAFCFYICCLEDLIYGFKCHLQCVADIAISRSDFPSPHPRFIDSTVRSAFFPANPSRCEPLPDFQRAPVPEASPPPPTTYTATCTPLAVFSFQAAASRLFPLLRQKTLGVILDSRLRITLHLTGNPSGHSLGYFGNPHTTTALQPTKLV